MSDDRRVEPSIESQLESLSRNDVRFVVFGSAGALLYGAHVRQGDLNTCPTLDLANLERLGRLLPEIQARPRIIPDWMTLEQSSAWSLE